MNLTDLAKLMQTDINGTIKENEDAARAVFNAIQVGVWENGEKFNMAGFGTFTVKVRAARDGRNPSTGESIRIQAKRSLNFKASGKMKSDA